MPHYSSERKASVLKKLLPPQSLAVTHVSKEEGISEATLYNWLKQLRNTGVPVPKSRSKNTDQWDGASKLATVIATAGMNESELSSYCREKGLYPEEIKRWKQSCIDGAEKNAVSAVTADKQLKTAKIKIKQLEKDLNRKDKALAESAALLVLQKKFQALWEDEEK